MQVLDANVVSEWSLPDFKVGSIGIDSIHIEPDMQLAAYLSFDEDSLSFTFDGEAYDYQEELSSQIFLINIIVTDV